MADDALTTIRLRNDFYRDNYRRLMAAFLVAIALIVGLVGIIGYLVTHRPKPVYFATTASGRIIHLVPLSSPLVTQQVLLQWAVEAATSAYTFDFINYRKELQQSQNYFTPKGWNGFIKQLKASGNLEAVKQKRLIVSAVPGGAPVILQEGMLGNRYAWKVQMPILVTYSGGNKNQIFRNSLVVTLLIERVSTLTNPRGLGIAQINFASS